MVGSSIYTVTSVLTQRELDSHCSTFNILANLRPKLPNRNATIKDSPAGKIGMYTRFIEFANFCIPLSKFLLCVLEYYQINLSQLSVIGAAKDPLPVDKAMDLPCVELLNENRTVIQKYPESFLCVVGLSRLFTEIDVRPIFLHSNDEEMGFLDFVNSADPFKVKTDERTLAENEVPLLTETKDMVISHFPQSISLVNHTIQNELSVNVGKRKKKVAFAAGSTPRKKARTEGVIISDSRPATVGKSPTALRRLIKQSSQAGTGSGSSTPAAEDFVSSFVTPTPFVVPPSSSVQANVGLFAIELTGETRDSSVPENEIESLFAALSQSSSSDDFYESQTINFATAQNFYAPNWNVTNNARIDNPAICQSLLDHVTPPRYWAALRNQHDVGFLDSFNI
ncbi:hypothetical protein Tco_0956382, partial [Tanacetum coccineum]